jgi:dTDP-4-dehydrorhamnose 3,5-epimerase
MHGPPAGHKDEQSVKPGGGRVRPPAIEGVIVHELGNVITRSGFMTEVFRTDWAPVDITVRQVNWVELNPGAVTDWHAHFRQKDHLVAVNGNIKLALWDGRPGSPTHGACETVRMGAIRPVMVIVPPGVWHGLRNESGERAGYINVIDRTYDHADPDNWRAKPKDAGLPDIL